VRQFTALCSERAEDTAAPVLAEAAAPPQRTKKCRFCGEDIAVAATKCRYCGEWLQRVLDVPPPQIGIKVVPPASAVVFTIITLGIYQIFWLHRVFTELHARGSTETTPGKAVGFHFIPFFNLVWIFIVWKRLGDAIAREYVNARLPAPGTGVLWLGPIAGLLGLVELSAPPVAFVRLILLPIAIANGQRWLNELAALPAGRSGVSGHLGSTPGQPSKDCPTCGESIALDALQCRYCGHGFTTADVAALKRQLDFRVATTAWEMRRRSLSSRKTVSQVFGWILTVVGVLFSVLLFGGLIASFTDAKAPPDMAYGVILALVIFCAPPITIGVFLLRAAAKAGKELARLAGAPLSQDEVGPMRTVLAAILLVALCVPTLHAKKWTDSSGKYAVDAEYVDVRDGQVRLKKADGNLIAVGLDRLSQSDQLRVGRRLAEESAGPVLEDVDIPRNRVSEPKWPRKGEKERKKGSPEVGGLNPLESVPDRKTPRIERLTGNLQLLNKAALSKWQAAVTAISGNELTAVDALVFLGDFDRLYDEKGFRKTESDRLTHRLSLLRTTQSVKEIAEWTRELTRAVGSPIMRPLSDRDATVVVIIQQDAIFPDRRLDVAMSKFLRHRVSIVPPHVVQEAAAEDLLGKGSAMDKTDAVMALASYDSLFAGTTQFRLDVWKKMIDEFRQKTLAK